MDGDSSDESRNRVNSVPLYKSSVELRLQGMRNYRGTQKESDASDESTARPEATTYNGRHSDDTDESSSRETGSSHTDEDMDGDCKSAHLATNLTEYLEGHQTTSTGMVCDESISRGNRCSMSNPQWTEQLVAPVPQSGSIDATVVNKQDVDECWVTNKHTNVKQDSISVSNKWLSGTFSKIAFSVWGKSKEGEEITENVHANNKPALTFMPEFDFSL